MSLLFSDLEPADAEHSAAAAPPAPAPAAASTGPAEGTVTFSLVVPVYRNEESIPALVQRVVELSSSRDGDFEAVFVVDGSPDASLLVLRRLLPDSGVRAQVVTLSRNFGAFAAIRAGLAAATGEYLAVMAADLQEPASLVEAIFDRLAQGDVDVAVGVRTGRDDPALSSFTSALFWRTYRRFVQRDVPPGGVDIFGCSRQVVLELLRLEEAHSSLVGLLFWVGFRRAEVPYERAEREHGKSAWSLRKKVRYMADSIFSFTDLPILVLITAGVLGVVSSLLGGLVVFVGWASGSVEVAGYTPLMLVLCLLSSSILLALGIVGSYVWRTYENSKRRPFAVPMMHEHFGDRRA